MASNKVSFWLEFFVRSWRKCDTIQRLSLIQLENFDIIVPVSYTTLREKLTLASEINMVDAISIAKHSTKAPIIYSCCEYTFEGSADIEGKYKRALLKRLGHCGKVIRAKNMNNSAEEALVIRDELLYENISARRIAIVTGEMHGRSARFIWEKVFPNAAVFVFCVSHTYEYQPDHLVKLQRGPWRWAFANVARQILLHIFGLRISRFHHDAVK